MGQLSSYIAFPPLFWIFYDTYKTDESVSEPLHLTSLFMISSRSIHVAANFVILFNLIAKWYSIMHIYQLFYPFICS